MLTSSSFRYFLALVSVLPRPIKLANPFVNSHVLARCANSSASISSITSSAVRLIPHLISGCTLNSFTHFFIIFLRVFSGTAVANTAWKSSWENVHCFTFSNKYIVLFQNAHQALTQLIKSVHSNTSTGML